MKVSFVLKDYHNHPGRPGERGGSVARGHVGIEHPSIEMSEQMQRMAKKIVNRMTPKLLGAHLKDQAKKILGKGSIKKMSVYQGLSHPGVSASFSNSLTIDNIKSFLDNVLGDAWYYTEPYLDVDDTYLTHIHIKGYKQPSDMVKKSEDSMKGIIVLKKKAASKPKGNIEGLAKHLAKKYGGDPHFFTKCSGCEELSGYDDEAKSGICAKAHKLVTGHWPAQDKDSKKKKEYQGCSDCGSKKLTGHIQRNSSKIR